MSLFGGKKKEQEPVFDGLLGIDIGTLGMKVVEVTLEKGKPRLTTYGYSEFAEKSLSAESGFLADIPKAVAILKRIFTEAGVKAKKGVAALPASEVFHTIVSIPVPQKRSDDIRPAIEAQAKKFFPLPIEEMVLDSTILDKDLLPAENPQTPAATTDSAPAEKKAKFMRVLLTGAPKTLIQKYIDLFAQANIELVSLETEVFAMSRALVGDDPSRVMIVDIGGKRTNVTIVDHGVPFLTRGIKAGGESITQALAAGMGLTVGEAEKVKRDLAFSGDAMPKPLEEAMKPIVHEMRYALELYSQQSAEQGGVEKILVTGGSAHLPGLDPYLTSVLGVNVYVGNPWSWIATPPDAQAVLEEVGPRLAVAAGLALRIAKSDRV